MVNNTDSKNNGKSGYSSLKTNKLPKKENGNGVDKSGHLSSAGALQIARLTEAPETINSDIVKLIPEEVAEKYNIVAFDRVKDVVKVAMVDTQDIDALNALRFLAEKESVEIEVYVTDVKVFGEMMESYSAPTEIIKEAVKSVQGEDAPAQPADVQEKKKKERETKIEIVKDAPVAKLVEVIISHAMEGRASDIHIEPMEGDYRVRFRVDGVLHVSLILPKEIGPAVISRIKIMANLKIDEKRKPQDGRFRISNTGKNIDFRISSLPVLEGEKIVMRILDKDKGLTNIEKLGLLGTALDNMNNAILETYGMVLITGPTGSGKSTTLYALLKVLNNEERNIITLEDPIEYFIEGLNQSQIKPEIGYTFASGLRTILRQDPNVIMVGEIRDGETAELAVHAALTGHLMFSTLHTNTAIGAIPRLMDMGIEPFLLSASLRLVVAQRLVRKICDNCKQKVDVPESVRKSISDEVAKISPEELQKYDINLEEGINFYHGQGCDICNGTGLKGRLAVYEVVPINEKIRDIITEKKGNEELITQERSTMGILTMKQDGILKIIKGWTTIEEIERVIEGSITLEENND